MNYVMNDILEKCRKNTKTINQQSLTNMNGE